VAAVVERLSVVRLQTEGLIVVTDRAIEVVPSRSLLTAPQIVLRCDRRGSTLLARNQDRKEPDR
jgi:hypothetical protein